MVRPSPKVSIGLPVYNGADHLDECLRSLLDQTFEDFELLIVDNASTDQTEEICRDYLKRDPRIEYVRQPFNVGAAANFNEAFRISRGTYFKWAAHDDICAPDFLKSCVDILDNDPQTVLAFTATELINDDGSFVVYDDKLKAYVDSGGRSWALYFEPGLFSNDSIDRFRSILLRSVICHEIFGLIRSDVLRDTCLIGDYYGSDKVLLAELALQGKFHQVSNNLFYRRCHTGQSSKKPLIEKEKWISGRDPGRIVFPQKRVLKGYLQALMRASINPVEKARGLKALLRYVMRPEKLKRLNIASKSSYVRINVRRNSTNVTV